MLGYDAEPGINSQVFDQHSLRRLGEEIPCVARMVDVTSLPAHQIDGPDKGAKICGGSIILFGLLWAGLPTLQIIHSIASGKVDLPTMCLLVFSISGLGIILGGVHLAVRSTTTTIDSNRVTVLTKGLFGAREWSERLSSYKGVLSRSICYTRRSNPGGTMCFIVQLRHSAPRKTITLYEANSDKSFRAVWEAYARLLKLPAIQEDGKKVTERTTGDLDKSLKELIAEGKVAAPAGPMTSPPSSIRLRRDGQVLELTVTKNRIHLAISLLFVLLGPALFIYVGFFIKGAPIFLGFVGAVFLGVVLLVYTRMLLGKETIRLGRDQIKVRRSRPRSRPDGANVLIEDIKSLRLAKAERSGWKAVSIETHNKTVRVGEGLSAKSLEWLQLCILREISASALQHAPCRPPAGPSA